MPIDSDALRKLAEALNTALVPAPGTGMKDALAALHIARSEYLAAVTPSAILSLLNERAQLLTIAERAQAMRETRLAYQAIVIKNGPGIGSTSEGEAARNFVRCAAELDAALKEIG